MEGEVFTDIEVYKMRAYVGVQRLKGVNEACAKQGEVAIAAAIVAQLACCCRRLCPRVYPILKKRCEGVVGIGRRCVRRFLVDNVEVGVPIARISAVEVDGEASQPTERTNNERSFDRLAHINLPPSRHCQGTPQSPVWGGEFGEIRWRVGCCHIGFRRSQAGIGSNLRLRRRNGEREQHSCKKDDEPTHRCASNSQSAR